MQCDFPPHALVHKENIKSVDCILILFLFFCFLQRPIGGVAVLPPGGFLSKNNSKEKEKEKENEEFELDDVGKDKENFDHLNAGHGDADSPNKADKKSKVCSSKASLLLEFYIYRIRKISTLSFISEKFCSVHFLQCIYVMRDACYAV